ncbi:CopG family transcriptional regulator [Natronomonas sp. LN261]|jgi:predicted DNA-binding protein|uniref:CopG family transcriptional regulator n=1 Tax=Natronomonas sp. LN261 TaxID=2750669 RepID=UPI0015EF65F5|nr:CopG family transcriptional regulator [Natronomonas sp. LN261]
MPRYCLECDDRLARRLEALATKYGLTEEEVITQLVEVGIEEVDGKAARRY